MKTGIIRYPGSNCDFDALNYFENSFFIWHNETELKEHIDLLVIPGGFAFGDRVYDKATGSYYTEPATKAIQSPVSKIIKDVYNRNIPILGICNGFQILIKMGLLPGKLVINNDRKFHSYYRKCIFQDGEHYDIPIANKYGNYINTEISDSQIFLKYDDSDNYDDGEIAGIHDVNKKVFALMPHPERVPNKKNLKNKLLNIIFPQIDNVRIHEIMSCEHVSYKSTKKFLSNLYTEGLHVIQGPGENAGIIDIGDNYALCLRIESHNHPIYINPFQGAATGVGGILRDIFTMGARPIALFDFLRFGTNNRAREIERGTISGISYYGNCVGVPVVGGDYCVDSKYNKNPLLNVGCIGIVKKDNIIYGNVLNENRNILYIGARTSDDGVGGADMASKEFGSNCVEDLESSIQSGDPFLEKLLLEVCVELAEQKLVEGMQDMGAGGLLCSSLELVIRGRKKTNKNFGCCINVDKVPVKKYLDPTDTLISESQERMLLICSDNNLEKIFEICNKWDIECTNIGKVTNNGKYIVKKNKSIIYSKNIDSFEEFTQNWTRKEGDKYHKASCKKTKTNLKKWSQYDNTLGGRTIKGPLESGSYSIINLPEINKKLYVTWGANCEECFSKLNRLNSSIESKAVVNCLNFGHPEDTIGSFEDCVNTLISDCEKYDVPVIGGNVSLYNCTNGTSIPSTPIIMMIGVA